MTRPMVAYEQKNRKLKRKDWPYLFEAGSSYIPGDDPLRDDREGFKREIRAAREWCADQFGPIDRVNPVPDRRWYYAGISFYFRHETDATAFKIRWG